MLKETKKNIFKLFLIYIYLNGPDDFDDDIDDDFVVVGVVELFKYGGFEINEGF
jgi:hypothetical protein